MRKIVVFNLISLDGFFAGEDGNIDWHNVDDEFNKFGVEQTKTFSAIIFGRTTYQMFEAFWPKAITDSTLSPEDHQIAQTIDDIEKIVFSKTLKEVTWKNSKLFHEIDREIVAKWKDPSASHSTLRDEPSGSDSKSSGSNEGDMVIFGSGTIVQAFTNLGLIDEYRLLVNPVILGKGKSMFTDTKEILKLTLLNTRTFGNGNVLLSYTPVK